MDNFEVTELTIEKGDRSIFSIVYLPHDATSGKRCPVIIYAHGMTETHASGEAYAREFAKRGYVVCCFDFCGPKTSQSSGKLQDMTLFSERADVETVCDALVKRPYADANNVFLMGTGMGGAAAALAASARAGAIKGLILLYPAFSLPDLVQRQHDAMSAKGYGDAFFDTLEDFDIYEAIRAYTGPVLILHGSDDHVVSSPCSVQALKSYEHASLELISGAGHGFTGGQFKYAVRMIVGFLDEETDLADESGLDGDLNFPGGMGGMGF